MTQGNLKEEFPDYPEDTLPTIPAGFVPTHWHNDACPSWERGDLKLFIDYPDAHKATRAEFEGDLSERFSLMLMTDSGSVDLAYSDDWSEILAAIAAQESTP
jgi:hypothetical protein